MTNSFLYKVADNIVKTNSSLENICFVFPNKRSALHFKNELINHIDQPIWSPDFVSSEDLVFELTGLKKIDSLEHLFILYHEIKKTFPDEDLKRFISWGQNLINDFNEIDSFLVDTEKLFKDVKYIKDLELWKDGEITLSEIQQNFNKLWGSLLSIYTNTQKELLNANQAYPGLAYKQAALNIVPLLKKKNWNKIYFVGFNAFNTCEEKIILHLFETGNGIVVFDADDYYLKDQQQEAGRFLRSNIKAFKKYSSNIILIHEKQLEQEKKSIHIIGIPGNVAQAQAVNDIVQQLPPNSSTAVVLPDEGLATLGVNSFNFDYYITIGFPVKQSATAELINQWFDLHFTKQRLNFDNDRFYYKSILQLISHPILANHLGSTIKTAIEQTIAKQNTIAIRFDHLSAIADKELALLKILLSPANSTEEIKSTIEKTLAFIENTIDHLLPVVNERICFYETKNILIKLVNTFTLQNIEPSLQLFHIIFNQELNTAKIPYKSPDKAFVNIMGMLETRCLDFENIVMVSVNEGIVPAGKSYNSFVPFDIRKGYGLPTHHEKDSIFSYHFYRLLQRASTIYLTYSIIKDVFGSKEKSRYLYQITNELIYRNPKIELTEYTFGFKGFKGTKNVISIPKTEPVLKKIQEAFNNGISATALINFINCELKFYLLSILKIKETEEVAETIEQDVFGTVVHKVLEDFYKPYLHQKLTPELFSITNKKLKEEVIDILYENKITSIDSGENYLIMNVIIKFLENYFAFEKKQAENNTIVIQDLEKEYISTITLGQQTIKLKGKIDRVDLFNDVLRLIDYKTGHVEEKDLKIGSVEELLELEKPDKAFQLLFYNWLVKNIFTGNKQLSIFPLKTISSTDYYSLQVNKDATLTEQHTTQFEIILTDVVKKILSTDKPFVQTEDTKKCEYCNFKIMCGR